MRGIDGNARQGRGDGLEQLPLMRRIEEGEDQRNGDGLRIEPAEFRDHAADLVFGQALHHAPEGIDALAHLDHVVARDHGFRLLLDQGIGARPHLAGNLQHIAAAQAGDESRPRALAHQEGIGRHREAMDEEPDVGHLAAGAFGNAEDAGRNAAGAAAAAGRQPCRPARAAAPCRRERGP